MAEFWRDYVFSALVPGFLQSTKGAAFCEAIADEKEDLRNRLIESVKLRDASIADPSSYRSHLGLRDLPIISNETSANALGRILNAFPTKQKSGTDSGIVSALNAFGVGTANGGNDSLGSPSICVKYQKDFSPSWDFERYANDAKPSYMSSFGSAYKVADAESAGIIQSGYLQTFSISKRYPLGTTALTADDYLFYINSTANLYRRYSDGKLVLTLPGSTVVSSSAIAVSPGGTIDATVYHSPSATVELRCNGSTWTGNGSQPIVEVSWLPETDPAVKAVYRVSNATVVDNKVSAITALGTTDPLKNLSQATAAKRPTYTASNALFNGQPTMEGTGGQWLDSSTFTNIGNQITYIFVGKLNQSAAQYQFLLCDLTGYFYAYMSTTEILIGCTAGIRTNYSFPTSPCVVACVFDGATGSIYVNNSQTPVLTGNITSTDCTSIRLAAQHVNEWGFVGSIAEAQLYASNSAELRQKAMLDAASRFGISGVS